MKLITEYACWYSQSTFRTKCSYNYAHVNDSRGQEACDMRRLSGSAPVSDPLKLKHASNHKHHRFVSSVNVGASDVCPFFTMSSSVVCSSNCRRFQSVYPLKCHEWNDGIISTMYFIFNSVRFRRIECCGMWHCVVEPLTQRRQHSRNVVVRTSHHRRQLGYCWFCWYKVVFILLFNIHSFISMQP